MRFVTLLLLMTLHLWGGEQRIVALSPAINEILFALGKGAQVVGNTTYATYPEAAKQVPKVGGYFSVSLEKILACNPTLVLMQRNNLPLRPKLEKLGIRTEVIRISSLESLEAGIRKIGALTGAESEAKQIVSTIETALQSTAGIVTGKKILIVFGLYPDLKREIYISGNHLYFADIIRRSGNRNAFEEETTKQPTLSQEGIIALNPDIVYILSHRTGKYSEADLVAPWLKLPIAAAKAKTVYVNTHRYAGMPSQRVVCFIHDFREVLQDAQRKLAALRN